MKILIVQLFALVWLMKPDLVLPKKHPRLAHFSPYWWGDSLNAIVIALKNVAFWGIDQNIQIDANGVAWVVHWGRNWGKKGQKYTNNLGYITRLNPDGSTMKDWKGRELAMPDRDREKPFSQRTTREVNRLRSKAVGGRRLYTAVGHIQWLGRQKKLWRPNRPFVLMFEPKGIPSIAEFQRIQKQALASGVLVGIMRLQDLPGWAVCLWRAKYAGLPTALLARGSKPANWESASRWTDAVWGVWR